MICKSFKSLIPPHILLVVAVVTVISLFVVVIVLTRSQVLHAIDGGLVNASGTRCQVYQLGVWLHKH